MQAVSYLRVSGASQVEGDGFPRQRKAIAARAAALGLELVGEFADEGVSGARPLVEREGLMAALSSGVTVVLVERADRLSRDLIEGELILRECRRLGVRVVESEGGQDLTAADDGNPTAVLIRQVLGAFAQFEKASLVLKLRAAKVRKRTAAPGWREGRKPYGAREGEGATLDRIRGLAAGGATWEAIAATLNAEGHRTRKGTPWSRGSVYGVAGGSRVAVA
jgi:DNA invertase Pin-like site-specific DNA recombinase